jgi:UDP-N-acetylmuramate--alanine ligase
VYYFIYVSLQGVFNLENSNVFTSPEIKHIHFIGIGGSSMSGLAEILLKQGYKISGSDIKNSDILLKLAGLGATVHPFHSGNNIEAPDLIVYTVAVKDENPELIRGRQLNIPIIDRATLLGQLMKEYPYSVAVSGTHGKTTTTSMVTMIMLEANQDPTVHIGGELGVIGGNTRIGGEKFFITEACEYYESFLKFNPYLAIILNIELDHVDYFKDLNHFKEAFYKFASLVPKNGFVVGCKDDENVIELFEKLACNKITYGVKSEDAMWRAENIIYNDMGCASFSLIKEGQDIGIINLSVPGIHNVNNSLAAISACFTLGCSIEAIKEGIYKFTGTNRRFQTKGIVDNIRVVDDYAHHPTEVSATLRAAKNANYKKVWCVFQPHTYTRTKSLINDFSEAFYDADYVLVSDIYAAREVDKGEIHASKLAEKINDKTGKAQYIHGFDAIVAYLEKNVSEGDLIITMGAGDIFKVGEMFIEGRKA